MAKIRTIIDSSEKTPLLPDGQKDKEIAEFFGKYQNAAIIEDSPNQDYPSEQTVSPFSSKTDEPEKKTRKPRKSAKKVFIGGEVLTGALFITLVDMLLPMAIATINNKFSNVKVKANDLAMTAAQRKELEPICDEIMQDIGVNANPYVILIVATLGIYGLNTLNAKLLKPEQTVMNAL